MNPAAPHYLPSFITGPGETDVLMVGSTVFLVVLVVILGGLYFWLHAIPERVAHGASKLQFQLVGVLSLLALFTHNNAFWVAALLLALVPVPDFWTPITNMADSLARMAARRVPVGSGMRADEPHDAAPEPLTPSGTAEPATANSTTPDLSGEAAVAVSLEERPRHPLDIPASKKAAASTRGHKGPKS